MQKYIFEIPNHAPADVAAAIKSAKLLQAPEKLAFCQEALALLLASQVTLSLLQDNEALKGALPTATRSWTTAGAGVKTLSAGGPPHTDVFLVTASLVPIAQPDLSEAGSVILELKIELNPDLALEHRKYTALLCENARRMIHDLAQPVQAIYAFGASLLSALTKDEAAYPPKQANWIRTSNDQTERLVSLIKEHRTNYTSHITVSRPCRPCWTIALLLGEFEDRVKNKVGSPVYHPLLSQNWVEVDLEKLLTCVALYLSIVEDAAPDRKEGATAAFGFLPNPETADTDGSKIFFGFRFPFADQTRSKWLHPAFDPRRKEFGFGYLSLMRGLEELGSIWSNHQTGSTSMPPEFIGVLLNRQE